MFGGDRILETAATPGAGNVTLAGAVAKFQSFASRLQVNELFEYAIVHQSANEWETGKGYLSGGTTLVRDEVFQSSNADALVNFSAGTVDVFVTIPADFADRVTSVGLTFAMDARNILL